MRPEEAEKLLGAYAAGTLSESERSALFQAALTHQELFDALAEDEALRDLLSDPRCRRRLLALLSAKKEPVVHRILGWVGRPRTWALAGSVASVVLVASIVLNVRERAAPRAVEKAVVQPPAQVAPAAPAPAAPAPAIPPKPRRSRAAPPQPEPLPADKKKSEQNLAAGAMPAAPLPREAEPKDVAAPELRAERLRLLSPQAVTAESPAAPAPAAAGPPAHAEAAKAVRQASPQLSYIAGDQSVARDARTLFRSGRTGLRCSLFKEGREVSPGAALKLAEAVELRLQAGQDGFLYVLGAEEHPLYQSRVRAFAPVFVPLPPLTAPGEQRLRIIFSKTEWSGRAESDAATSAISQADEYALYVVHPAVDAPRIETELILSYR